MTTRCTISLRPQKDDKPLVVAKFEVQVEMIVPPAMRDLLEQALDQTNEDIQIRDPHTGKIVRLDFEQLTKELFNAIDIADSRPAMPKRCLSMEVANFELPRSFSLTELYALDTRLRTITTVMVEGVPPKMFVKLVNALSTWEFPSDTIADAKAVKAKMAAIVVAHGEPASAEFIASPEARAEAQEHCDEIGDKSEHCAELNERWRNAAVEADKRKAEAEMNKVSDDRFELRGDSNSSRNDGSSSPPRGGLNGWD